MLRHLLMFFFALHCMLAVPLAQPKEETKAQEMESLFEDDMNKRSKEVIMYGNQQNKGKSTQAGMIDSDLVPQDSNDSEEDDEKNGHGGGHKSDEHQSNDDHSQSDESEESYARVLPILPAMSSQQIARPKQNVEDILPDVIDAYKTEEDWENYKNTPYDYYRDLVFRRKRSMDRRHAMKKRNYVAAREHLIKRRSDKRSRFRRDLNLDDKELMQLINILKENTYPYDRKRRQYYRPDLEEIDNDDDDDENEEIDSDELNGMFAKNNHQEFYNPYYYPSDDNALPPSNIFRYNNDDSGESDEDDNDDNDDDEWKRMGPARSIDIRRRSEFFYPPMDYRFMMVPGQKRRLPMHDDESEGFWGSFDDKRTVKKKRGYYFGEEEEKDDDDDDEESDEEKLKQILEMASYMKSRKRNYRSIR